MMVATGLLVTGEDSRHYHLGPFVYELVGVASPGFDLRALAEPVLRALADQTESTVMLSVREGLDGLCVRRISGAYPIQVFAVEEGARRPLGVGAGTQVLLAALPEVECYTIVMRNLARCLELGLDETSIMDAVERIRKAGYASQPTAKTAAAWTVSMSLLSNAGRPVGSVSVLGITERMTGAREAFIFEAVLEAKRQIEAGLATA
jgi:DNA-binding IclR family transcriptional regulator